jgi:hypothetical protein
MIRVSGFALIILLSGLISGFAQVADTTLVPLVDETLQQQEIRERRLLWKKEAADNALRSGLASIAVGLYSELLTDGEVDEATRLELELNRISALIALGEIGRADEVLGQFGEIQDSRFNLRRALVSSLGMIRPFPNVLSIGLKGLI